MTGSHLVIVTYQGLALLAERQPAIYTALLAIVYRHMKVWIGWVPSIP